MCIYIFLAYNEARKYVETTIQYILFDDSMILKAIINHYWISQNTDFYGMPRSICKAHA